MEDGLSIILPAYNEEVDIKNVISNTIFHIRKYLNNFEVIVVNDGSIDTTFKKLNEIKMLYPELKIISYKKNKGYGYAIREGFKYSQKKWIFIMDSDGQFRIDNFDDFWKKRWFYDFILGYRKKRADNLYRIILAKFGNFVSNLMLQKKIKDINCGFKLFKVKDLENLPLISTGGSIYFEMLFYLLNSKYNNKFLQLPVRHYKRIEGRQAGGSFRVIFRNILEGVRIVLCK